MNLKKKNITNNKVAMYSEAGGGSGGLGWEPLEERIWIDTSHGYQSGIAMVGTLSNQFYYWVIKF